MSRRAPEPSPPSFAAATLWIVDLDGVVWLAEEPIGDVAAAASPSAPRERPGGLRHQQLGPDHR